jgi:hypothetical protein
MRGGPVSPACYLQTLLTIVGGHRLITNTVVPVIDSLESLHEFTEDSVSISPRVIRSKLEYRRGTQPTAADISPSIVMRVQQRWKLEVYSVFWCRCFMVMCTSFRATQEWDDTPGVMY